MIIEYATSFFDCPIVAQTYRVVNNKIGRREGHEIIEKNLKKRLHYMKNDDNIAELSKRHAPVAQLDRVHGYEP